MGASPLSHVSAMLRHCSFGVALALAACHAATPLPRSTIRTAAAEDADEREARELISALAAGSADAAEASFDQRMHDALPAPVLLSQWRSLQARYGALVSWRIVKRDRPQEKDRFTIELVFSQHLMDCLVVLEPSTHRVIGLFFLNREQPGHTESETDPAVHEEALSVGPLALPAAWVAPVAGSAPFAAALLVGGSGPNDRDETIANAKPFRDLARGLAKRGIATLRYDKRSFAHPELWRDPANATVESEVLTDAISALQLLRGRPEVDQQRIFIVGHSLGALLAPEVAQRSGGVAGLVLLAAPGRPLEQVLLEQLKAAQPKADFSGIERQVKALPTLPATTLLLGVPAGYWRDVDGRDEMAIAAALGRPVLLLRGSLDRNVAAIDQERWLTALSGRIPVSSATLPGLDHLFLSATESAERRHVASEVIDAIARFIGETAPDRISPRASQVSRGAEGCAGLGRAG